MKFKTYKLNIPLFDKLLYIMIFFGSIVLAEISLLGICFRKVGDDLWGNILELTLMFVTAFYSSWILFRPHHIMVSENGQILFISLIRKRKIHMKDIVSIEPNRKFYYGWLDIKTQKEKITLINRFDNFHEFLNKLEKINPSAEIKGC